MKDRTTMAGREAALERELARKAQQARKRRRRPVPVPDTTKPPQQRMKSIPDVVKVSDPVRPRRKPSSPGTKPDVGKMTEQLKKLGGARKEGPKAPPAPPRGPIGSKKAPPTPRMPTIPKMPPKPKVDPNRFISVADFERSGGLGKGPAKGTPKTRSPIFKDVIKDAIIEYPNTPKPPKKPKQEPVMVPGTRTPMTKTSKGGMYEKYPQRPGDFKKGGTVGSKKKPTKQKIRGAGIERKGLRKAKIR